MSIFDGISAVIVTRGDVDMTTILNSMPFDDVVVWDNSVREDMHVWGRFCAVEEAKHEWIYTQDDDLLVPIPAVVRAWHASDKKGNVANNRADEEWRLNALGTMFHRDTLRVFKAYTDEYGYDLDFRRVCDIVHAYRLPWEQHAFGYLDFPWGTADNRMYKEPDHYEVRIRARDRALALGPG